MKNLMREPRFVYPMVGLVLLALFFGIFSFLAAKPANATGSDGPLPYTVTADGLQLPDGVVFEDGGHVNTQTNQGDRGIHFEALNNQPSGQWIGKSFLPWSAFGYDTNTLCTSWVQVWLYNGHFGEGGQEPVGYGCGVLIPPVHTEVPTPSPTPTPPIDLPIPPGNCFGCEPPTEAPDICAIANTPGIVIDGGLSDEEKYWCAQFPPAETTPPATDIPAEVVAPAAVAAVDTPVESVSSQPRLAETGSDVLTIGGWLAGGLILLGLFTWLFRKLVFKEDRR